MLYIAVVGSLSVHLYFQLSPFDHYTQHIIKTCLCYIQIFAAVKNRNFIGKKNDIFNIFAQNIDCGYTFLSR